MAGNMRQGSEIDFLHRLRHINILWHIITCIFLFNSTVFAGAWVQKKRSYYFKVAGSYVSTGEEFDHEGNRKDILADFSVFEDAEYREVAIFTYLEYGLLDRLTLVGNLPFKFATTSRTEISNYFENGMRDVSHTTTGFSDLYVGGRVGLLTLPLVVSVQSGIKVPLGYAASSEIEGPALGNHEVEYEVQLLAGQSLHPLPAYLTGGLGYRIRSSPLHDEVFFDIEAGYSAAKVLLKFAVSGVNNTTTPIDIYGQPITLPLPEGGGAVPDRLFGDQNFLKLNAGLTYQLRQNIGLDAQIFHLASGENIVTGTTVQFGLVFTSF